MAFVSHMVGCHRQLGAIVLAAGLAASSASAQWTVVSLHPAGAAASEAWDIHDGQQVGAVFLGGTGPLNRHAAVWTGSAASMVDVHPPVATFSYILGTKSGQHVGAALVDGFSQASFWTSTSPYSWLSLHPSGADFSVGMGGGAGGQVGRARFGVGTTICGILWNGTAGSAVNLHPFGQASETWAKSIDAGQQAGSAAVTGLGRSSLWTGTAASWIDLTPPGRIASTVEHTQNGWQVGMVVTNDQVHAALWNSTPESWINLNPAGTNESWAYGVFGDHQVGYASFGGQRRAAYWNGTAASFVNLHDILPAGTYTSSEARSAWADSSGVYVVGWARATAAARNEAIMWVLPPGPTPCYPNCDGSTQEPILNVADFSCFLSKFAAADPYANCDGSTQEPVLNIADFSCFLTEFAAGCR